MMKLRLYYDNTLPNFGDALSLYIAEKLYGPSEYASKTRCNAVFLGSLLGRFFAASFHKKIRWVLRPFTLALPPAIIWGAGYIEIWGRDKMTLYRKLDVRACRGYLTLARLRREKHAIIADDVVCADPGLLAGKLIDTSEEKKTYTLGIIPHYVDKSAPILQKIQVNNAIEIDIQLPPDEFMKKVAACEGIISSALHGLVAADSLGIPNIRMVCSDKIAGGDYKYDDYYSAFGMRSHKKINLHEQCFSENDLKDMMDNYPIAIDQVEQLQDALLDVFPWIPQK